MPLPHKKNFLRDVLPKDDADSAVPFKKIRDDNGVVYTKINDPVIEYKEKDSKWKIWSLAVIAIIILGVVIVYAFSSATVTVLPRTDESSFNADFSAKVGQNADPTKGELGYYVSNISKIGSKEVAPDGERAVDRKATGVIVIYNKYSEKSQKLIKNTRFETPEGLIFRIDRSVVVPGRKTENGQIVPGSVETTVYANEPGEKYNIGMTDFTVPGFKSDTARYNAFYARSKTAMTDGFSGTEKYVTDAKQKLARTEIRAALEQQILSEANVGQKKDYFIPKGAYTVIYESLPSDGTTGASVTIKEKANFIVYAFKVTEWDKYLGAHTPFSTAIASSTVEIGNRNNLDFIWKARPKDNISDIAFRVGGTAHFIWVIKTNSLAVSLAGKKKTDMQSILKEYDSVASASASLSPFWLSSFPQDPKKIKIVVKSSE